MVGCEIEAAGLIFNDLGVQVDLTALFIVGLLPFTQLLLNVGVQEGEVEVEVLGDDGTLGEGSV